MTRKATSRRPARHNGDTSVAYRQFQQVTYVSPRPPQMPTIPQRPVHERGETRRIRPIQYPSVGAYPDAQTAPYLPPRPVQHPQPVLPQREARTRAKRRQKDRLLPLVLVGVPLTMLLLACALVSLGGLMLFGSGNALPGVTMGGVELGGMSQPEAAAALQNWRVALVEVDGDDTRAFPADPTLLGITLNVNASAEAAVGYGRSEGGFAGLVAALTGDVTVPPTVTVDMVTFENGLLQLLPEIERPPRNAGVQFVDGEVRHRPAEPGRALDISATVEQVRRDPAVLLADGELELVMGAIHPSVTDATPLVEAARALLSSPLEIRAYNPATDDSVYWVLDPAQWGNWVEAATDADSPTGLSLSLDATSLRDYLNMQAAALGGGQYLDLDEGVAAVQAAVGRGQTNSFVRVYNQDRQHMVQSGETITSIAWNYGVPYPWVQQANPGVDALSPGQTITIPSPDMFTQLPVNPDKRIVVDISEQRVRVYENGSIKWDWLASTGISSSPTWTGIYQIISHEPNAYAGNWNLWMPNFMGVYQPVPGADFTNGFHGFPTRGNSQLLWTNSLGTRVTYGCILISDENIRLLYDWAEEGVIVEIQA